MITERQIQEDYERWFRGIPEKERPTITKSNAANVATWLINRRLAQMNQSREAMGLKHHTIGWVKEGIKQVRQMRRDFGSKISWSWRDRLNWWFIVAQIILLFE